MNNFELGKQLAKNAEGNLWSSMDPTAQNAIMGAGGGLVGGGLLGVLASMMRDKKTDKEQGVSWADRPAQYGMLGALLGGAAGGWPAIRGGLDMAKNSPLGQKVFPPGAGTAASDTSELDI